MSCSVENECWWRPLSTRQNETRAWWFSHCAKIKMNSDADFYSSWHGLERGRDENDPLVKANVIVNTLERIGYSQHCVNFITAMLLAINSNIHNSGLFHPNMITWNKLFPSPNGLDLLDNVKDFCIQVCFFFIKYRLIVNNLKGNEFHMQIHQVQRENCSNCVII